MHISTTHKYIYAFKNILKKGLTFYDILRIIIERDEVHATISNGEVA